MHRRDYAALLLSLLLLAPAAVGCGRKAVPANWTATIQVQGPGATVTVAVPGLRLGKDYHVHLNLDDGPQVMMYASTYTFPKIAPGHHQVTAALADPQHQPIPGQSRALAFDMP